MDKFQWVGHFSTFMINIIIYIYNYKRLFYMQLYLLNYNILKLYLIIINISTYV
jgi:hypothetical protein